MSQNAFSWSNAFAMSVMGGGNSELIAMGEEDEGPTFLAPGTAQAVEQERFSAVMRAMRTPLLHMPLGAMGPAPRRTGTGPGQAAGHAPLPSSSSVLAGMSGLSSLLVGEVPELQPLLQAGLLGDGHSLLNMEEPWTVPRMHTHPHAHTHTHTPPQGMGRFGQGTTRGVQHLAEQVTVTTTARRPPRTTTPTATSPSLTTAGATIAAAAAGHVSIAPPPARHNNWVFPQPGRAGARARAQAGPVPEQHALHGMPSLAAADNGSSGDEDDDYYTSNGSEDVMPPLHGADSDVTYPPMPGMGSDTSMPGMQSESSSLPALMGSDSDGTDSELELHNMHTRMHFLRRQLVSGPAAAPAAAAAGSRAAPHDSCRARPPRPLSRIPPMPPSHAPAIHAATPAAAAPAAAPGAGGASQRRLHPSSRTSSCSGPSSSSACTGTPAAPGLRQQHAQGGQHGMSSDDDLPLLASDSSYDSGAYDAYDSEASSSGEMPGMCSEPSDDAAPVFRLPGARLPMRMGEPAGLADMPGLTDSSRGGEDGRAGEHVREVVDGMCLAGGAEGDSEDETGWQTRCERRVLAAGAAAAGAAAGTSISAASTLAAAAPGQAAGPQPPAAAVQQLLPVSVAASALLLPPLSARPAPTSYDLHCNAELSSAYCSSAEGGGQQQRAGLLQPVVCAGSSLMHHPPDQVPPHACAWTAPRAYGSARAHIARATITAAAEAATQRQGAAGSSSSLAVLQAAVPGKCMSALLPPGRPCLLAPRTAGWLQGCMPSAITDGTPMADPCRGVFHARPCTLLAGTPGRGITASRSGSAAHGSSARACGSDACGNDAADGLRVSQGVRVDGRWALVGRGLGSSCSRRMAAGSAASLAVSSGPAAGSRCMQQQVQVPTAAATSYYYSDDECSRRPLSAANPSSSASSSSSSRPVQQGSSTGQQQPPVVSAAAAAAASAIPTAGSLPRRAPLQRHMLAHYSSDDDMRCILAAGHSLAVLPGVLPSAALGVTWVHDDDTARVRAFLQSGLRLTALGSLAAAAAAAGSASGCSGANACRPLAVHRSLWRARALLTHTSCRADAVDCGSRPNSITPESWHGLGTRAAAVSAAATTHSSIQPAGPCSISSSSSPGRLLVPAAAQTPFTLGQPAAAPPLATRAQRRHSRRRSAGMSASAVGLPVHASSRRRLRVSAARTEWCPGSSMLAAAPARGQGCELDDPTVESDDAQMPGGGAQGEGEGAWTPPAMCSLAAMRPIESRDEDANANADALLPLHGARCNAWDEDEMPELIDELSDYGSNSSSQHSRSMDDDQPSLESDGSVRMPLAHSMGYGRTRASMPLALSAVHDAGHGQAEDVDEDGDSMPDLVPMGDSGDDDDEGLIHARTMQQLRGMLAAPLNSTGQTGAAVGAWAGGMAVPPALMSAAVRTAAATSTATATATATAAAARGRSGHRLLYAFPSTLRDMLQVTGPDAFAPSLAGSSGGGGGGFMLAPAEQRTSATTSTTVRNPWAPGWTPAAAAAAASSTPAPVTVGVPIGLFGGMPGGVSHEWRRDPVAAGRYGSSPHDPNAVAGLPGIYEQEDIPAWASRFVRPEVAVAAAAATAAVSASRGGPAGAAAAGRAAAVPGSGSAATAGTASNRSSGTTPVTTPPPFTADQLATFPAWSQRAGQLAAVSMSLHAAADAEVEPDPDWLPGLIADSGDEDYRPSQSGDESEPPPLMHDDDGSGGDEEDPEPPGMSDDEADSQGDESLPSLMRDDDESLPPALEADPYSQGDEPDLPPMLYDDDDDGDDDSDDDDDDEHGGSGQCDYPLLLEDEGSGSEEPPGLEDDDDEGGRTDDDSPPPMEEEEEENSQDHSLYSQGCVDGVSGDDGGAHAPHASTAAAAAQGTMYTATAAGSTAGSAASGPHAHMHGGQAWPAGLAIPMPIAMPTPTLLPLPPPLPLPLPAPMPAQLRHGMLLSLPEPRGVNSMGDTRSMGDTSMGRPGTQVPLPLPPLPPLPVPQLWNPPMHDAHTDPGAARGSGSTAAAVAAAAAAAGAGADMEGHAPARTRATRSAAVFMPHGLPADMLMALQAEMQPARRQPVQYQVGQQQQQLGQGEGQPGSSACLHTLHDTAWSRLMHAGEGQRAAALGLQLPAASQPPPALPDAGLLHTLLLDPARVREVVTDLALPGVHAHSVHVSGACAWMQMALAGALPCVD